MKSPEQINAPTYREIRKLYITSRIERMNTQYSGNWRNGRKEDARREFDEFVERERQEAIAKDRAQRGYTVTINYPLTGKSAQVYVLLEPGESVSQAVVRSGDATDEWTLEEVEVGQ